MAVRLETINVNGVRCERCVNRLAVALRDHEGLESARASLAGEVSVSWDDGRTSREAIVGALARAGFHELTRE